MDRIRSIEPFAVTFYENREKPQNLRIALSAKESAAFCRISIDPETFIGCVDVSEPFGMFYIYHFGVRVEKSVFERHEETYPEYAHLFRQVYDFVKDFDSYDHLRRNRGLRQQQLIDAGVGWGGDWIGHSNPDYDLLLREGTDGLRSLVQQYRDANPGKDEFYEGCMLYLDAIDILGDRLRAEALRLAEAADSEEKRAEYEKTAQAYSVIPRKPAYDMRSAVLLFWLVFSYDGVDSPGRLDQFLLDYWRRSSKEDAVLQLERLWKLFHATRTWNLCLSGSDENWNDNTNELTYAVLDAAEKYRYQTPNITLRVHRNTPEALWKRAADVLATGIGMPALYNDEVVCPALEKMGIPPQHSHLYCMNGCNQIDIMGKSHMGLEDGDVNFGKCLELALHNGTDSKTGRQLTIHTGDPVRFKSFDELMRAFLLQLEYVTGELTSICNDSQLCYAETAPSPLRSVLIDGCLQKGTDYKNGGPLYGDGQFLAFGMAETADSLAAVKRYVYEEGRVSMAELLEALRRNFEGYEELYRLFSGGPKFGNDDPYVDSIAKEITDHWFAYLKTRPTFRGGFYTGGCSPFVNAASMGRACGALPNGHRSGDPHYSDCIGASPGMDRNGPTAALKSALSYDQTEVTSGFVMHLRFEKSLFCSEQGKNGFLSLARSYFRQGGQQLSVNVLNTRDLLKAREDPDAYPELVVRVGGYSDYFAALPRDLQDNVIARSVHSV